MTVKNAGNRAGKEIVQLYVRDVESKVIRPVKELKDFAKVELAPGVRKTVTMRLDKRSFAFYDVELKDWRVEEGEFEILIGKSSRDIVLSNMIRVKSTTSVQKQATCNSTVGDVLVNPATRQVMVQVLKEHNPFGAASGEDFGDSTDMMEAFMKYLPLRALVSFVGGAITEEHLEQSIAQLNESK